MSGLIYVEMLIVFWLYMGLGYLVWKWGKELDKLMNVAHTYKSPITEWILFSIMICSYGIWAFMFPAILNVVIKIGCQ